MMSTAASSEHADLHLKSSYDLWDSVSRVQLDELLPSQVIKQPALVKLICMTTPSPFPYLARLFPSMFQVEKEKALS